MRVGHAELVRVDADRSRLVRVGVSPRHRARGVGRRMMEAVLAEASVRGDWAVELNVYASNAPAVRLYRSLGFEALAGGDDVVRMARPLLDPLRCESMPELQAIAHYTLAPGTDDEVLPLVRQVVEASRAEPGNVS